MSRLGFPGFKQELEVICTCGQTEFKVQLSWMEEVRISRANLRSDIPLINRTIGHREAVRLFGRAVLCAMLTFLQQ